ncbi:hypothetical protein SPBR_05371 [Sporothrix brasiliensis 5110]|uniref:Uncharacterized protein n=1 Tax=Sporothrix brasiliensis 5110 TaxID=1398154 RepID=A0A0C2IL55_9PEZI|nr:uncharacterized protein SPBR_05371 [Sporothrix brasiliensis 5110]KIH87715.1 hypothetical protein SPBR_05371 [Sporothrix brasiliensis 5110]
MYIPSQHRSVDSSPPHSASLPVSSSALPPTVDSHVATDRSVAGFAKAAAEQNWAAVRILSGQSAPKIHSSFDGNSKNNAASNVLSKRQSAQTTNVTIGVVVAVLLTLFVVCVVAFMYRYRYTIRIRSRKKRRHRRRRHAGSKSSKSSKSASDSAPPSPADGAPGPSQPPPSE